MKKLILAILLLMLSSPVWAAPDADHDADRGIGGFPTLTAIADDDWLLLSDVSNSNRFSKILKSNFRAAIGLGVNDNPSWLSVHASGGNLAASNAQVTKKWITGLSYTADVTSVIHGGKHYICTSTHTAGSSTEPDVGISWETVWKPAGDGVFVYGDNTLYTQDAEPAACLTGDMWVDTNGTSGQRIYTCESTNTWVAQAGSGGDDLGSAAASDVIALFNTGTCSGYLKSDGTCDTPSGAAHDAVTLDTETAAIFSLNSQQITLDSQTANYFLAAPNGSAGDPSFRAIADADIPSTIARDSEIPTASSLSVDDLITLSGVATGAVNLGSFTGTSIADNLTIKAAFQDLETDLEALPTLTWGTGLTDTSSTISVTYPVTAEAFSGSGWNGDTGGLTRNDAYDYTHLFDTDDDGLPDKVDLASAGLVETDANGVLGVATAGTDYPGLASGNAFTGANDFGGATSLEVPNGSGPTVDAVGEVAVDTTSDQLVFYGGAKRVIPYIHHEPIVIKSPTDADDFLIGPFPYAATLTNIKLVAQGGGSIAITPQICGTDTTTCSSLEAITADGGVDADDGSLSYSAVVAGGFVKILSAAPTGTVGFLSGSIYYTITAD